MIARVTGRVIENLVPLPTSVVTSIMPLSLAMLVLTMSMPTPRPETSLACSRVEKPGAKMRLMASVGAMLAASSGLMRFLRAARSRMRSQSMPLPSSSTSMTTRLPFWNARSSMRPAGCLPMRTRSAAGSMP